MTVADSERPDFLKRIGKTIYKVNVHFSTTSKETMSDKIIRLLRNAMNQHGKMQIFL
ncbi:MAG: transposon-encoded TnpW family protein [Oscillospiraceae bacterium]|nr:transposon-encoded TnpW family protein [Oscillospiraceae bacterium]